MAHGDWPKVVKAQSNILLNGKPTFQIGTMNWKTYFSNCESNLIINQELI
jgi:hypothetical protein